MQIEKQVLLKASLARVWSAISDSAQFGAWFGMLTDGPFVPGKKVVGTIQPTKVDPDVAKMQEPHKGMPFSIEIVTIDPQREVSFRWHPFAIDKEKDYSSEPTTLVRFVLEEKPDGVLLTITESGFENIPIERRAKAMEANDGGWAHQCKLIEKYLGQTG